MNRNILSLFSLVILLALSCQSAYAIVPYCSQIFEFNAFRISTGEIARLSADDLKAFLDKPTFKGDNISEHPWINANLTNPLNHNSNKFMYVIHGIKKGVPQELPNRNPTPFISASLISNDYVNSFGRFGYILDVTADNVVATWPVDGETRRNNPWEYRHTQGVYSPEDLIERSGWFWQNHKQLMKAAIYNEILLDSGATSVVSFHKVKISGIFIILDKLSKTSGIDPQAMGWDGPSLSDAEVAAAEVLAKKYNLPLIKIVKTDGPSMIDRRN